ncbi:MAG: hypothetical protein ACRDRH_11415 [Pseudonocardia sp.]
MPDLRGIQEDVKFNWNAAAALVAEFRSTANMLSQQIGVRKQIGAGARKQWEGSYAGQFDGRTNICTGDAHRFVVSMRKAADDLEELARLARQEQQRRVVAREWVAQQERKNWFERNVVDPVKEIFGEADLPPPPPRVEPPKISIHDAPSTSRGSAMPGG